MFFLANIFDGAVGCAAGAVICFALLWWRERSLNRARTLEAQVLLDKARSEAEIIKRDASAAASQEALKLREQIEQSFTARRAERAESERRLAERETLINSQLQQMMTAEKGLKNDQKLAPFEKLAEAQEAGKREVSETQDPDSRDNSKRLPVLAQKRSTRAVSQDDRAGSPE